MATANTHTPGKLAIIPGYTTKIGLEGDETRQVVITVDCVIGYKPPSEIAARLMSCWNACESIPNPEAIPEAIEALKFYVNVCGNTCYQVSRETAQEMWETARVALDNLAKLGVK